MDKPEKEIKVSEKDKKEILCKALEQGWEIKKVDSKSYLLKRKKPSKK
jgi:hypothetical protein